ncbi:hypothetical protein, partial [Xanthomonas citri]|uniref:hypothetical protein n=1 Tax=Xanthomonas citri TaxID=346 RepID=UPI001A90BD93
REHANAIAATQRPDAKDDTGGAVLSLDYDDGLGLTRLKALESAARKREIHGLGPARDVEHGSTLCHIGLGCGAVSHVGNRRPAGFFYTTPENVHGT